MLAKAEEPSEAKGLQTLQRWSLSALLSQLQERRRRLARLCYMKTHSLKAAELTRNLEDFPPLQEKEGRVQGQFESCDYYSFANVLHTVLFINY